MDKSNQNPATETEGPDAPPPMCACVQDPFAVLPPELRPKVEPKKGGLRKATCPGCGLTYWTNRATDLCIDCEKKGIQLPPTDAVTES